MQNFIKPLIVLSLIFTTATCFAQQKQALVKDTTKNLDEVIVTGQYK